MEAGVHRVTLARENKKNALNTEMYRALVESLHFASQQDDIRVLLLEGSASCFCAGNDLAGFSEPPVSHPEQVSDTISAGQDVDWGLTFIKTLLHFDKPLVAAVNGPAVGIGATLLLHCDLVYASRQSYFKLPFVDLGICPEFASTLILPQQLGLARANAMLLLGEAYDAQEWFRLGLVTAVTEADARTLAWDKARYLASKPQQSLLQTKRLIAGHRKILEEVVDAEAAAMKLLLTNSRPI